MKIILLIFLAAFYAAQLNAQAVFLTKHGQVSFFSKTSLENIDAVNNEVASVINTTTGELGFAVLVKSFHFEKALMEEHFNENYMESDKIPKANFKGKITNLAAVNFSKDGTYPVTAAGDMVLHGVTRQVTITGTAVVTNGLPRLQAKFKVQPKDYGIKIPSLVAEKIAESISVTVDCKYEKKP